MSTNPNEVDQSIHLEFALEEGNFDAAGDASGKIKRVLQQLGIRSDIIRRIAISAYEAEMNVIIHARHGVLRADIHSDRTELEIEDIGPGIEDIDMALTEGFSTAPDHVRQMGFGAGMGLPNMVRCSSAFNIESTVGEGTVIRMTILHDN